MTSAFLTDQRLICDPVSGFEAQAMALVASLVPVHGICFYRVDTDYAARHFHLDNLEGRWLDAYHSHFARLDPLHPVRFAEGQRQVACFDAYNDSDPSAREYAAGFLIPQGTPYQTELFLRRSKRIVAGMSLLRGTQDRPFSRHDLSLLERTAPFIEYCYEDARRADRPDRIDPSFGFTARECEIARLIARGFSNKDICRALSIELPTAKTHVKNIFGKTGARSRTAMIEAVFLRH
jgi:DNA-binding CsgD family transcriptional regulator